MSLPFRFLDVYGELLSVDGFIEMRNCVSDLPVKMYDSLTRIETEYQNWSGEFTPSEMKKVVTMFIIHFMVVGGLNNCWKLIETPKIKLEKK